jgi:uncharacterized Rossmann fold enzyme
MSNAMFKTPLTADERLARVRENILAFRGARLPANDPAMKRGAISICGFGPSLADTWEQLKGAVMTTSGAHDFLLGRGIVPRWHVETDPREHKAKFVAHPHADTTYLINSQCHPRMFANLASSKVVMWHGFTNDDMAQQITLVDSLEPGAHLMGGGTNVGMRAIVVARELGYTSFHLHGMDCCFRGAQQWADEHFTKLNYSVQIEVEGRAFYSSEQMMQSTDDFFTTMHMLPGCSFRIHGDGLLEARMNMFMRDPQKALKPGWWQPISFALRDAA